MLPNEQFYELQGESTGKLNSVQEFLMRCLLGARAEAELPSNENGFDEDVNVYLVGLLGRFLSSAYHEETARYQYASDLDLAEAVAENPDDRHRYRLYRTNADHLLLAIGLFQQVERQRPHMSTFAREPEQFIGRGGTYYGMASSSLRRLRRRSTGTEVALNKLATGFADYAKILSRVRASYFHLTTRLGEGRLYHLLHDPLGESTTVAADAEEGYDRFLDAYSAWRDDPGAGTHRTLGEAVDDLRKLDPDFAFEMPAEPSDETSDGAQRESG